MWRLALLIWVITGTVLAGIFITVVLLAPGLEAHAMKYIPIAALIGAIVGIPVSVVAAKAIAAQTA